MDLYNASAFTRRQFLHSGLTLASAAATIPWFLNSSALGMPRPLPARPPCRASQRTTFWW
jgi:hypothetical protein